MKPQSIQLPESHLKVNRVKSSGNLSSSNKMNVHLSVNQSHLKNNQREVLNLIKRGSIEQQPTYINLKHSESKSDAASLLLQYNNQMFGSGHPQGNQKMSGSPGRTNVKENSPHFLQINLKMFNNYMTSNNPQNINNSQFNAAPSGNKFASHSHSQEEDSRVYNDDQISPQMLQFLKQQNIQNQQNFTSNSRERSKKGKDPLVKMFQDNEANKLIQQVSMKNLELQYCLDKNKNNISSEVINQIHKQGIMKSMKKLKEYGLLQDISEVNSEKLDSEIQSVCRTIQENSGDKKRPQSELANNKKLYFKCQQQLQDNHGSMRMMAKNGNVSSFLDLRQAQRMGSQSSCSLLEGAGKKLKVNHTLNALNDDSQISDEVTPNQNNHIHVLVSMLNEKNQYIKKLHRKVDNLNDIIQNFSESNMPTKRERYSKLSPANIEKSRSGSSNHNIQRAKSASQLSMKNRCKSRQNIDYVTNVRIQNGYNQFEKMKRILSKMKEGHASAMNQLQMKSSATIDQRDLSMVSIEDFEESPQQFLKQNLRERKQSDSQSKVIKHQEDDSYSDFLNNADLEHIDETLRNQNPSKQNSNYSSIQTQKQEPPKESKLNTVRNHSQKTSARGIQSITPAPIPQKNQKQSLAKNNIPSYRPPTIQAVNESKGKLTKVSKIASSNTRVKKSSMSLNLGQENMLTQVNEPTQHLHLVEQLNIMKCLVTQKDKKIDKHKDFIEKLKQSLQNVLVDHKKQEIEIDNQRKELQQLKGKLGMQK